MDIRRQSLVDDARDWLDRGFGASPAIVVPPDFVAPQALVPINPSIQGNALPLPVKVLADTQLASTESTRADLDPHLTAISTGQFTIGYDDQGSSDFNAYGVQYFAGGAARSLLDAASTGVNETQQGRAGLANGNVAMVWTNTVGVGDTDITASVVDPTSFDKLAPFLVNTGDQTGLQNRPEVVGLTTTHRLAFAWIDVATNTVRTAIFGDFGTSVASNITVSTTAVSQGGGSFDLGMTALTNGNYAVSWRGDDLKDHFRVVGPTGALVTGDITVASATNTGTGDIIQLANGNLEAVYATGTAIAGHAYTPAGASIGSEFTIASTAGDFVAETPLQDGRFMVVYQAGGDILGRVMNPDGTPSSAEFTVNTDTTGTQGHPTIDTLADGQVAVAWEDSRTGAGDIYFTIFDPRQGSVDLHGSAGTDSFAGTALNDTLTGGPGNDELTGRQGADSFVYTDPSDGTDTIRDFQRGQDHIVFGSDFLALIGGSHTFQYGATATTAQPTVLFNTANHTVLWDSDGSGPVAAQTLAIVGFADGNDKVIPFLTQQNLPDLTGYSALGTGDFNGDGTSDIVLSNNTTHAAEVWYMGSGTIIGDYSIGNLGSYTLAGTGDFNHDGTADMVWKNNFTGATEIWQMHDGAIAADIAEGNLSGYTALGTGDFNGDGTTDIVWRNNATGATEVWYMGGGHIIGDYSIGSLGAYNLLGTGDFNGDGTTDMLWQNATTGVVEDWLMSPSGAVVGDNVLGNLSGYRLVDVGDLNHDGTADLVWQNLGTNLTTSWAMYNGVFTGDEQTVGSTPSSARTSFGDFNHDGGNDALFLSPGNSSILDIEHLSLSATDFLFS